jgi:hypothetical protein
VYAVHKKTELQGANPTFSERHIGILNLRFFLSVQLVFIKCDQITVDQPDPQREIGAKSI